MNKAPGIDSVGSRMLIEIADELSVYVAELYNKSLKTGDVPEERKLANVTPIYKKGKRSSSANYRPVSLTVTLCKVLEFLIQDKVMEHQDFYKLVKDTQHGFVKNRSCLTNLLILLEEVINYVDSGYPVDIIYLDFQKAFVKIPHKWLLHKLAAHGIKGELLCHADYYMCGNKLETMDEEIWDLE